MGVRFLLLALYLFEQGTVRPDLYFEVPPCLPGGVVREGTGTDQGNSRGADALSTIPKTVTALERQPGGWKENAGAPGVELGRAWVREGGASEELQEEPACRLWSRVER